MSQNPTISAHNLIHFFQIRKFGNVVKNREGVADDESGVIHQKII